MIYKGEICCKTGRDKWSFKKCLVCEQFTAHKSAEGWACSCAMNTDPKGNYHYTAVWQAR